MVYLWLLLALGHFRSSRAPAIEKLRWSVTALGRSPNLDQILNTSSHWSWEPPLEGPHHEPSEIPATSSQLSTAPLY